MNQGLLLSGIGILITFSALGILILLILLLKSLFPVKDPDHMDEVKAMVELDGGRDLREQLKKQAAATAVAALLSQKEVERKSNLGILLEGPVGNWWHQRLSRNHKKE